MKYVIILIGDESKYAEMTEEQQSVSMDGHGEFMGWCEQNNVAVHGGETLQDSPATKTISLNGDVTDGPYFEIKEQLGGYYLIKTDSSDLALEAALKCPNYGANELRPVVDMG